MFQVSIHSYHLSELLLTSKKEILDIVADALASAEEEARAKTLVLQQLDDSNAYISYLEMLMSRESQNAVQDIDKVASNVLPPATRQASPRVDSPFLRLSCPSPYTEKILVGGFLGAQQKSWRGPSPPSSPRIDPLQTSGRGSSLELSQSPRLSSPKAAITMSLRDLAPLASLFGSDGERRPTCSWENREDEDTGEIVSELRSQCKHCQSIATQAEVAAKTWESQCTNLCQQIRTLETNIATSAAAAAVAYELQLQQVLPNSRWPIFDELCAVDETRKHAVCLSACPLTRSSVLA